MLRRGEGGGKEVRRWAVRPHDQIFQMCTFKQSKKVPLTDCKNLEYCSFVAVLDGTV